MNYNSCVCVMLCNLMSNVFGGGVVSFELRR